MKDHARRMKDNGTQLRSELTSCIRQMQAMANQIKQKNPGFEVPGMAETQQNLVVSGAVFQQCSQLHSTPTEDARGSGQKKPLWGF